MGGIGLLNLVFIVLFYKELKLATFDAGLAAALGFSPALIHYALMGLVSVTAVGAFDSVGSILVVALMIAPPAAAYLLTESLPKMIGLSVGLGVLSAVGGYWVAHWLDVSIAGTMAVLAGLVFAAAWILAPERGLIAQARRRAGQRWEFAQAMLVIHLLNHENTAEAETESRVEHLRVHMRWQPAFASEVVRRARQHAWIREEGHRLWLTDAGRRLAQEAVIH
jgi:manganese/zinc/iron transport system permease protein